MFNISLYLTKFKNIGQGERLLKESISSAIKEVVGLNIETKNINTKNGEVVINVSSAMKNAIYIKKQAILEKIKEKNVENLNNIR